MYDTDIMTSARDADRQFARDEWDGYDDRPSPSDEPGHRPTTSHADFDPWFKGFLARHEAKMAEDRARREAWEAAQAAKAATR